MVPTWSKWACVRITSGSDLASMPILASASLGRQMKS